ncbi:MAG: hypothetical protein WCK81_05435 [Betaproteobacteria bacterium]
MIPALLTWSDAWATLTQSGAAVLPDTQSLPWVRHAIWSLVLSACVLLMGRVWAQRRSGTPGNPRHWFWPAGIVAAWAWVPGDWGISYWLGLPFQIPSLVSGLLAITLLVHASAQRSVRASQWGLVYAVGAALLGWVLLLDTFALFPVSLYAWGFEPAAYAALWALALVPWVVSGHAAWRACGPWQLCAALLVFGLGRWPSGNLWDAVLDPGLWLVLQALAVRRLRAR